jgi:hypothetical protein
MLAVAIAILVVCCGAVVVLLVRAQPGEDAAADSSTGVGARSVPRTYQVPAPLTETRTETRTETEYPAPTTEEPSALDGYQQVSGPGGLTTYVPAGWPTKVAGGPGAMQADDPGSSAIVLRYGGGATPVSDTYQVHADYERQFAANRAGYVRTRLDRTAVRGTPAVDWEFEYDPKGDVRRHVRSVYWLYEGFDYFVYVSAPVGDWSYAQEIFDVMRDNATP